MRWVVGLFCALIGALMLVTPHQFSGPTFQPIRPWLTAAGMLYFLAGASLVAVSAVAARGPVMVAASSAAAMALLTLAASFGLTGGWTGVVTYSVLAAATLVSPFCDVSNGPGEEGVDLFVLTAATASVANGLLLLALWAAGLGVFYDPLGSTIGWHGALFLVGGVSVLMTRLREDVLRPARIVAQLTLGFAFLAWMLGSSIPNRIWTGILLYGGIATTLVLGTPVARRIARLDPSSLRVRLGLAMASAAAFPLLIVAAIATGWEERAAADQQLALQQAVASGLAADVSGVLTQHLVGLTLVAEHPVVLARSSAGREALLGDVGEVAPGFTALGTFDGAGRPIVVLGRRADDAAARLPRLAAEALRRLPPGLGRPTPFLATGDDPPIVLAVPIRQEGGAPGVVAVGELDRRWLETRLQRSVGEGRVGAVVVDGAGRAVVTAGQAAADGQFVMAGRDSDQTIRPPIQALSERSASGGAMRFSVGGSEYLAGYARVLDTDWAVVVEQPVSTALATVWLSRELTFGVLLLAFLVAASIGALLASRLATPLALLARAAQALAAGSPTSLMPRSRVYEVRVVARAFAEMQTRLLARTAEHERAEARFRMLAGASSELTRSLDEEAIVAALAKIVVDELADWCAIEMLEPTSQEGGQGASMSDTAQSGELVWRTSRLVVRHTDAERQPLVDALLKQPITPTLEMRQKALIGMSMVSAAVTSQQLAALAPTAEQRQALQQIGLRSLMMAPLRVREQTIGTLTCALGRGSRRFDAEDLALAQELALRAALAIDNARLYAAEHAARSEAEAAVRVRDEFLAVAAHELKTPVTSLRGFAELAMRSLDRRGELDSVLARRTLETVDRQSSRLAALVANLLEVSRGSADRTQINPRIVNLMELARIVVETARVRAGDHQLTLAGPASLEIEADPLRIEQVLTNLLDNAVKYSPSGAPIEVRMEVSEDAAQLTVRDHGYGVPAEYCERIFDRFFQAHAVQVGGAEPASASELGDGSEVSALASQSSGMGLGLSICREIVERHGGTIRAELPADGGLRIVVTLPRAQAHAAPPTPLPETPPHQERPPERRAG